MKVVDCPEGKFYVCVKMFGGGMGDQIRRYCEAIPREVQYHHILNMYAKSIDVQQSKLYNENFVFNFIAVLDLKSIFSLVFLRTTKICKKRKI